MKKILFAASEAVPFIKTGGLADVAGTLPKYFDRFQYDVRVILPKYLCMKQAYLEKLEYVDHFYMYYNGADRYVGIMKTELDGIMFYFIDNEEYFGGDRPYGDWYWDLQKFCFFSRAALSALPVIGFQPDIIHCHDWQSALIPVLLKGIFHWGPFYAGMKTVMTIHNLKFQGVWSVPVVQQFTELPDEYFTSDKLEAYNDGNLLKGGLVYADRITTVSAAYAEEIKTPYYGEGLDGVIRSRENDLWGIVNGIDYYDFNPETDDEIAAHFSAEDFKTEKVKNKLDLQKQAGLPEDPDKFVIGIVSRLTDQKGFDLIACVMDQICDENTQVVVLGTGDGQYEDMFRYYAYKYPDRVSANIYYSEELSHKIYAGCDAFLMPSRFEPCGLSQLMSLRYGTIPIVRETGGLKDTVEPYNEYEDTGTGFSFANYNAHEMLGTINYARQVYFENKDAWNRMIERAMTTDFSWANSARQYEELYDSMDW